MAVRTVLVDDIDETEGKDVETITYGLHGATYEIDLSKKNAKALEDALAPFLAVSRKAESPKASTGSKRTRKSTTTETYGYEPSEVRAWAISTGFKQDNGKPVGTKGVIPQTAYDAFKAAQK